MTVPELTHLQFLVISKLLNGECSGRNLREQLAKSKVKKSGPAFYQMMARLEDANLVEGWYDEKVVEGQMIRERKYKLKGHGRTAYDRIVRFYREHGLDGTQGGFGYA